MADTTFGSPVAYYGDDMLYLLVIVNINGFVAYNTGNNIIKQITPGDETSFKNNVFTISRESVGVIDLRHYFVIDGKCDPWGAISDFFAANRCGKVLYYGNMNKNTIDFNYCYYARFDLSDKYLITKTLRPGVAPGVYMTDDVYHLDAQKGKYGKRTYGFSLFSNIDETVARNPGTGIIKNDSF